MNNHLATGSMSVCLSARIYEKPHVQIVHILRWPWLGPPLTAMQYVMYFRLCG